MAPLFGDTYKRAQKANSSEEFAKSKEAASAVSAWGSSLAGSALQAYGVGALINATGTLSYKGAAYLGSLIFFASAAPGVSSTLFNPVAFGVMKPVFCHPSSRTGIPANRRWLTHDLYRSSRKSSWNSVPWTL